MFHPQESSVLPLVFLPLLSKISASLLLALDRFQALHYKVTLSISLFLKK